MVALYVKIVDFHDNWRISKMAKPKTKDWKAWQNLQPIGPPKLIVIGKVETSNANQTPQLSERVPQGVNPKILLLDLTMQVSGKGGTVMGWQDVRFEKEIKKDQYSGVDVLWENNSVAQIEVETVQ
jgi:hypothetical protein